MIPALAALLVCQLVGEALVRALAVPVPGPVAGMAGLLLALVLRPAWLAALKPTTTTLLQHLSLLFVPAGVGVMLHLQRLPGWQSSPRAHCCSRPQKTRCATP